MDEDVMMLNDIAEKYGCSRVFLSLYIRRNFIRPVGFRMAPNHREAKLYRVTPEMVKYIAENSGTEWESDDERRADGWFTINEIARERNSSPWTISLYMRKTNAVSVPAKVGGHFARVYRMPESLESFRVAPWKRNRHGDWIDSVPSSSVREMVRNERAMRRHIGEVVRVVPKPGHGEPFEGRLEYYSMVHFGVLRDGKVEEFRTRHAKVEVNDGNGRR